MKGNLGFEIAVSINFELIACLRVKGIRVGRSFWVDIQDQDGFGWIARFLEDVKIGARLK